MTPAEVCDMMEAFDRATSRILFLDYDGTLNPITGNPEDSNLGEDVLTLIERISGIASIVIVSGRDRTFLEKKFRRVKVDLAAEYGAAIRKDNSWEVFGAVKTDWRVRARHIFGNAGCQCCVIEEKEFGIAVHFGGQLIEKEIHWFDSLQYELEELIKDVGLEAIQSPDSIELKPSGLDKGTAVGAWLTAQQYEFIFAAGDHQIDECMFVAMPRKAFTIRVGTVDTNARYHVPNYKEIIGLLGAFTGSVRIESDKKIRK
jgi:trehalose 6-phosphate synthase/phosphatase